MSEIEVINITLSVPHLDKEFEISLPLTVTGEELLKSIASQGILSEPNLNHHLSTYDLYHPRTKRKIGWYETLKEANVLDEDLIILKKDLDLKDFEPEYGKLIYDIPGELEVGIKTAVEVRLSEENFKDYLLKEGLIEGAEIQKIELGDIMKVTLEENSLEKGLLIKSLSTTEQLISKDNFTRWIFNLVSTRIGTGLDF